MLIILEICYVCLTKFKNNLILRNKLATDNQEVKDPQWNGAEANLHQKLVFKMNKNVSFKNFTQSPTKN